MVSPISPLNGPRENSGSPVDKYNTPPSAIVPHQLSSIPSKGGTEKYEKLFTALQSLAKAAKKEKTKKKGKIEKKEG